MNTSVSLNQSTKNGWAGFFKPFSFLFVTTGFSSYLLYFGVNLLTVKKIGMSPVFVTDGYHYSHLQEITEHPTPFLLTIAFIVSFIGAYWVNNFAQKLKKHHRLQILIIPWVAMVLTSPVWGVIWSIYRWPPKSFSDTAVMIFYYRYDALFGLNSGLVSAILSFPINILSYITVCLLLFITKKIFLADPLK